MERRKQLGKLTASPLLAGLLLIAWMMTAMADSGFSRILLNGEHAHVLGEQMDVYEDKGRGLTIDEIIREPVSSRFEAYRKGFPNWGFTDSAYWYRTLLVNDSDQPRKLILELTSSWIDSFKVYLPNRQQPGRFAEIHMGDKLPFNQRPVRHYNFLAPITLEAGEQLPLYTRVESRAAVMTPITLWEESAFSAHDRTMGFFFGAYFGVLGIMFVYNLFLYITLQDRNYLYYILFIFAFALMYSTSNGFTFMVVWPESPMLTERVQTAGISLFQLFGILFAKSFFETRKVLPILNRILLVLITLHALIILLSFFVEDVIPLAKLTVTAIQINAP